MKAASSASRLLDQSGDVTAKEKRVLIAIHRSADDRDSYADGWAECLARQGVNVRWVDLTAQDALRQVQGCEGVMWHWSDVHKNKMIYRILTVIELHLGIPVFPNHRSSWHRHNKLAQYDLFQAAGVPMPKTWIFYDKQRAREWALQTDYPKVFKLPAGRGGKDVILVSSTEEACHLIDRMFGPGIKSGQIAQHLTGGVPRNWRQLRTLASRCKAAAHSVIQGMPQSVSLEYGYVYFQELVHGNDHHTGINVIGDRASGYLRFNRTNDFRSYGKKRDYDPSHIDLRCVQMAFAITERLGFQIMSYDFLLHHGEPVVLEMDLPKEKTQGYWKRNLERVDGSMSPQEVQVEVFLNEIGLGNGLVGTMPDRSHADIWHPRIVSELGGQRGGDRGTLRHE